MLTRSFRVYCYYFAQFLKAKLAYKWDFFSGIIASLFAALSGVIYIFLLIDGKVITDLKGWGRNEVLFIYGYSLIATGIFGFLSPNLFRFGDRYVIQGQFDRVLLRPLNSFLQVVFESFNLENVGNVILGIILVVLTAQSASIGLSLFDLLVEPGSPQALAQGLLELYRDPGRRQRMGADAREYVARNFDSRKVVGLYEQLYMRL